MAISSDLIADRVRRRLTVRGHVQGVGFRPFVYRLAGRLDVAGHVYNDGDHVTIEVEGALSAVDAFVEAIRENPPPNARLHSLEQETIHPLREAGFAILPSEAASSPVVRAPPDQATCPDCVAEMFDPANRRYLYGLINCTQCGPRFTIIEALPYDRSRTTMRGFALCPACAAEYENPADRRFHAEPVACPVCGPSVHYDPGDGIATAADADAVACAAMLIEAGQVLALKGLGGYHLAVDATNEKAVTTLRSRKDRPSKPFAVMAPSLAAARELARLSGGEEAMLCSSGAPIVLAPRQPAAPIAPQVAPDCAELGVMLPYTPLHHLLMAAVQRPLVMTSGNRCGEPILYDDRSARTGLKGKAAGFLSHNRRIRRPAEDPVVRVVAGGPQVLRLGRGIAPDVIDLPPALAPDGPAVLALGGNLKVAPVLLIGREALCAPHVGDLDSMASEEALVRAVEDLQTLYGCRAAAIACDRHPDYATTHLAVAFGLPVVQVPHHLAHIMSVVAEHGLTEPMAGVAWDGTGHGVDGTVWGGEFLSVTADAWRRTGRLRPFFLPGGDQAVREPRRSLLGMLHAIGRVDLLPGGLFEPEELRVLLSMLDARLHVPATSSAGRLFDGFAALLGLCSLNRHEGEAAMRLEAAARRAHDAVTAPYPVSRLQSGGSVISELDWAPMVAGVAHDLAAGTPPGILAARVHETMAAIVAAGVTAGADDAAGGRADQPVALSGGCFQNRLLTERCIDHLRQAGRRVYINRRVPAGDGGLALGQALWARRMLVKGA